MSTKRQIAIKAKVKRMLKLALEDASKDCDKLLNSGAIDLNEFENDYFLPKIIASILLDKASYQIEPLSKEGKIIKKKLSYYV
jgi:hypothetical protein